MFRNYLLTAYKVFMRRKLFTAINLACIVLTLVVLMVVAAMMQTAFHPSGVEGKSDRFLQIMMMRTEQLDGESTSTGPLGFKLIDKYLKPMKSAERVAAVTMTRRGGLPGRARDRTGNAARRRRLLEDPRLHAAGRAPARRPG